MTIDELLALEPAELTKVLETLPDETLQALSDEVNRLFWKNQKEIEHRFSNWRKRFSPDN